MIEKIEEAVTNNKHTLIPDKVMSVINTSAGKASAMAAIPVPVIDMAAVAYVQLRMVEKVADIYGKEVEERASIIVTSIIGSVLSKLISEGLKSLATTTKLEQIFGESLIKAAIAGFFTTATGEIYALHFQNGGNVEDLSLDQVRDYIYDQFQSDRLSIENIAGELFSTVMKKFNLA